MQHKYQKLQLAGHQVQRDQVCVIELVKWATKLSNALQIKCSNTFHSKGTIGSSNCEASSTLQLLSSLQTFVFYRIIYDHFDFSRIP